jgi:molybdate transport system substrate-binding protein
MLRAPRRYAGCFATALFLVTASPIAARAQTLHLFAASSLKDAIDEVARLPQFGGIKIVTVYAATSALARQIENGAPADLIVTADEQWMDYLAERNLLDASTRVILLGNRLVMIAPANSKVDLSIGQGMRFGDALAGGRLAVADPAHVPAGKYARAAFEQFGVWRTLEPRLIRTENVRAALNFVARGEAPLGVVYETDARSEPRVRVIGLFPEQSHPPIRYPAAVVRASRQSASAGSMLAGLQSPEARAVFLRHGFTIPR